MKEAFLLSWRHFAVKGKAQHPPELREEMVGLRSEKAGVGAEPWSVSPETRWLLSCSEPVLCLSRDLAGSADTCLAPRIRSVWY